MSDIRVTALYKFVRFDDPEALREPLFARLSELGIKGTILLASEGVNGTIAGTPDAMDQALETLCALPGCADLEWKDSHAEAMPFLRLKVRLKNEIVTMGVPGTPIVTISFFRRTFKRKNGIASAWLSFHSRSAQPGRAQRVSSAWSMASGVPAIVPLTPSLASKIVPLMPSSERRANKGSRNASGSSKRTNLYRAVTRISDMARAYARRAG